MTKIRLHLHIYVILSSNTKGNWGLIPNTKEELLCCLTMPGLSTDIRDPNTKKAEVDGKKCFSNIHGHVTMIGTYKDMILSAESGCGPDSVQVLHISQKFLDPPQMHLKDKTKSKGGSRQCAKSCDNHWQDFRCTGKLVNQQYQDSETYFSRHYTRNGELQLGAKLSLSFLRLVSVRTFGITYDI